MSDCNGMMIESDGGKTLKVQKDEKTLLWPLNIGDTMKLFEGVQPYRLPGTVQTMFPEVDYGGKRTGFLCVVFFDPRNSETELYGKPDLIFRAGPFSVGNGELVEVSPSGIPR